MKLDKGICGDRTVNVLDWDAVRALVFGSSDGCDAAIGRHDQHRRLCMYVCMYACMYIYPIPEEFPGRD